MKTDPSTLLRVDERVRQALSDRVAVVALESTVIAHGLPYPLNIETALALEDVIRRGGAEPATIGVVAGSPTVGLNREELKTFAQGADPSGSPIEKLSLNNLAGALVNGRWGATTVAATMRIAHSAGLRVLSTGGIGGVHRGVSDSFDVSADVTALASIPVVCVCSGAKAILDLPKTIEQLETAGVPVIGFRTREFPAFYSTGSGLPVEITVGSAPEAAEVALRHWQTGGSTAVLVCVPAPEEHALPLDVVERAIEKALARAVSSGVRGKAITPFLLSQMERLTSGDTLDTNRALLLNNAGVAARIAAHLQSLTA